jgi:hypothetical protein
MEPQLACPNCRAENLPGALTCYRCNTKLAGAPGWVGPMAFKTYDPAKDRGIAYLLAVLGGVVVVIGYFLAWLGVLKDAVEAENRGTSAFDILIGSKGTLSAIGNGGVGEGSVSLDVRFVLLVALVAALAAIAIAFIKPLFGPLLACGLIVLVGPVYFLVQLVLRNNKEFNTPDLVSLLRWGFYITLIGGALIISSCFRYRKVPMMQSQTNVHRIN